MLALERVTRQQLATSELDMWLSFLEQDAPPVEAIGYWATGAGFADLGLTCQLVLAFVPLVTGRKAV